MGVGALGGVPMLKRYDAVEVLTMAAGILFVAAIAFVF